MKEFGSFTIAGATATGDRSRSSSSGSSPLRISMRERKDHQEGQRGTTSSLLSSSCPSNSMMTMMMASTRKVSFAEEGEHGTIFTEDPLASFRIPGLYGDSAAAATAKNSATTTTTTTIEAETLNVLNEEQRVVSNETIDSLPKKLTMGKRMNNSRSLPTLPRSGDLKSLLMVSSSTSSTSHHHYQEEEEEEEEGQHVPSVSEDCLLTRAHEHEENDDDMMNSYTFFSELNHSPSPSLEHTRHNIATSTSSNCSAATRNATKSKTTTCSGWGQFVDFMPMTSLDHSKRRSPRMKTKQLSPISRRRNNGSTNSKFLLRRHHLQHPYNILEKSSTIHRKMRKGHLTTSLLYSTHRNNIHNNNNTIKQQPQQQQQERHDNYHHTTSTNDIVNSFQVQLSL